MVAQSLEGVVPNVRSLGRGMTVVHDIRRFRTIRRMRKEMDSNWPGSSQEPRCDVRLVESWVHFEFG